MTFMRGRKPERRNIILHYHIFKNAGTTIQFILKSNFGRHVASLDSSQPDGTVSNDILLDFLERHRKIIAVTSHNLTPPGPEHENFTFHDIVFLRHPLARLSSMYDFYRRVDTAEDRLAKEAKRLTTADFMKFLIDKHLHQVSDIQVRYLSARCETIGESPLQTAFRIARQFSVLGVTENFDIAAVCAEHTLRPVFRDLSFAYIARNTSSSEPRQLDVHLAQFREACGDEVYQQLENLNKQDVELLRLANEEVGRRFQMLPDHENRLRNFVIWRNAFNPQAMASVIASNHPNEFVHYASLGTR